MNKHRSRFLVPHHGKCFPSRVYQYNHQKVWTICGLAAAMRYIKLRKDGILS